MFPFLIGRIRTEIGLILFQDQILFPFLIGRIRTENEFKIHADNGMFPFLIGRIRTKYKEVRKMIVVSFHSS